MESPEYETDAQTIPLPDVLPLADSDKPAALEFPAGLVMVLRDTGVVTHCNGNGITIKRNGRLKPVDITTLPYSGFPTDAQAQMMALMTLTPGIATKGGSIRMIVRAAPAE